MTATKATAAWHRATILSRRQLSPTVTGLTLRIDGLREFYPGQWLDFRPRPSSSWHYGGGDKLPIGGYSVTSIPRSLPQLDLAIRVSRHPVAQWVTNHAKANDVVDVRVGGTFTYQSACDAKRLLFIAGGVGINPPYSMIQQWHAESDGDSRAVLLYSCRAKEDFLFIKELGSLMRDKPDQFRVICTTTQPGLMLDETKCDIIGERANGDIYESDLSFREGRLDLAVMRDAVRWLNKTGDNTQEHGTNCVVADAAYICGPPGMPESMMDILSKEKLVHSEDNVHFEKWW